MPVIDLNIVVVLCCNPGEFDATMRMTPGRNLTHWMDFLEISRIIKVSAVKYVTGGRVWYVSNIDGNVPAAFR
jgi:hypothetical protein